MPRNPRSKAGRTRPVHGEARRPAAPAAPAPLVPAWLPPEAPQPAAAVATDPPPAHGPDAPDSRTAVLPVADAAPVFVDASGRRARLVRRLGILAGGGLIAYLVMIGVNLATGADVPLTPWPAEAGATRGPAGGDGKPSTRAPGGPAPAASSTAAVGSGPGSASPSGTPDTGGATPSARPAPSRTRGKAPATPPGRLRDKPKQNG
ncbi:hypothetical protein [Actinomadura vinacea]|uniref:hypothetical protein n=1 Tax=Actinomadura vinacea TaxID=115336 RepID=UPI0031D003AA